MGLRDKVEQLQIVYLYASVKFIFVIKQRGDYG